MRIFRFIIGLIMVVCSVRLSAQSINNVQSNNNGKTQNDSLFRISLKVVINGLLCDSEMKVSANVFDENERIRQIVSEKFADLEEYGITYCKIFKYNQTGCNPQTPLLIIVTKLPYYRIDHLVGNYRAKQGKQVYELSLNTDSTYTFSQIFTRRKALIPKIWNCGTYKISKGNVILISSNAPADLLAGGYNFLDTIQIKVNTTNKLTLPKDIWQNKKQLILKRLPNE